VFSLTKNDDLWTLHYEVSLFRRIIWIVAGLGGIGVAMMQSGPLSPRIAYSLALLCVIAMIYWIASDLPTTTAFDLRQRRVSVERHRPWWGRPPSFAFSEVAALYAAKRSGESTEFWEAVLELNGGRRIRLGSEAEGRSERVRQYLEEIRKATGIAGR
jgi:hypothetical protein